MKENISLNRKNHKGRWTESEHKRFLKGLEKYGRNWALIQKKIKSRSVSQVRSHAQKMFLNLSKEDIEALYSIPEDESETKHFSLKRNCHEEKVLTQGKINEKKQTEQIRVGKLMEESSISQQAHLKEKQSEKVEQSVLQISQNHQSENFESNQSFLFNFASPNYTPVYYGIYYPQNGSFKPLLLFPYYSMSEANMNLPQYF